MANTDGDQVILVDEHDTILGFEDKLTAHQKGVLHRAFSVCVVRRDEHGAWLTLLQQRHPDKYHCGGLWSNTCCSHPRPDEPTVEAAHRRLQEEMGLDLTLQPAGSFIYRAEFDNGLTEHELDHVFFAITDDTACTPHPDEVAATRWTSLDELLALSKDEEKLYTPWMKQALMLSKQALST